MQAMKTIDLAKVCEGAATQATKDVEKQVQGYVAGLIYKQQSLLAKASRLRCEADQKAAEAAAVAEQIEKIKGGDWAAVEYELKDKGDAPK